MMGRSGWLVGAGLLVAGVLAGVVAANQGVRPGTLGAGVAAGPGVGGMMGSGSLVAMGRVGSGGSSMMGGSTSAAAATWTPRQVQQQVRTSERGVTINRATNTITYRGHHDLLVPLAAPAALHLKGMQWEIDGLINPTVVVPSGARVTVDLVNADQGYLHGFEVTTARAPFGEMAMMQGAVAFPGAFIMPISPESHGGAPHAQTVFTTTASGTYSYICPVPGHAALGMAGTLRVS